jgi:hypothetical protein
MAFERLFQDIKGIVPLDNIDFSSMKEFYDEKGPIFIWLKKNDNDIWYRIFVDEICCVVDKYINENYEIDCNQDDTIIIKDHTEKNTKQKIIKILCRK